jgi:hypothetical protein
MAPILPFPFLMYGDVILRAIHQDFDDIHLAVVSVVLGIAIDASPLTSSALLSKTRVLSHSLVVQEFTLGDPGYAIDLGVQVWSRLCRFRVKSLVKHPTGLEDIACDTSTTTSFCVLIVWA